MSTDPEDLKIVYSLEFQEQLENMPDDLRQQLVEAFAKMRQAHLAVQLGQYDTFEDAMAALGAPIAPVH